MSVSLCPTFGVGYQAFTVGGLPLNAGLIYTYIAGGTTPQATYTTSAGNVQNANPIVLNADGRTPSEVWLTDGASYRFDVTDSLGNLIKTYDNISASISSATLAASGGSALIGFIEPGTGALSRPVQDKLREIEKTPQDYSGDSTGVASNVAAFQNGMAALSTLGGGKFRVPSGTYLFTLAGDSDSISVPSNVVIECDPGVVFRYGYNNSPLFVIANKTNARLIGKPKFVFTSAYNTDSSSGTTRFGYARVGGNYEWRAHVACVGSDHCEIDIECEGSTTAKVQDRAVLLLGKDDGTLTIGNKVTARVNDVCQGVAAEGQQDFEITVHADRYSSASSAVYGPGHALYCTYTSANAASTGGKISIIDLAGTQLSSYTTAAHSGAFRNLTNSKVYINSQRAEGAFYFDKNTNVEYWVQQRTSSTQADTSNSGIQGIDTNGASADVTIHVDIQQLGAGRNQTAVGLAGIAAAANNLRCKVRGRIVRNCDGSESTAFVAWVGNYGSSNVECVNIGSGVQKTSVTNVLGDDNVHHIRALGAVAGPRVAVTAGNRNTFFCSGDSTVIYDVNEFVPSSGNAVIWESFREYTSLISIGTTTDPTTTFQLPKEGAYLVNINLRRSDNAFSRAGLYWVVFDDAGNDYTTAQLIGTQITKGGGSAPSALTLAVSNVGLCTVTSTAASQLWWLDYGYRQISGT